MAAREEAGAHLLAERRRRIEKADRLLVAAIALRLQEVAKLQQWKRAHRLPAEDRTQERQVIRRARYWALANGVDPEVVEAVLLLLVREGKRLHVEPAATDRLLRPLALLPLSKPRSGRAGARR